MKTGARGYAIGRSSATASRFFHPFFPVGISFFVLTRDATHRKRSVDALQLHIAFARDLDVQLPSPSVLFCHEVAGDVNYVVVLVTDLWHNSSFMLRVGPSMWKGPSMSSF